jgi:hypothetical protein
MEFDILNFVLGVILGAFVGWRICERFHTNMLAEILKAAGVGEPELKRAIDSIRSALPEDHEDAMPRVQVRVEKVNGSLYAYRVDTEEFLGQGEDETSLISRIAEQNKSNFVLVVSQENGAALLQKNNG